MINHVINHTTGARRIHDVDGAESSHGR
jgi:hypothetical protein